MTRPHSGLSAAIMLLTRVPVCSRHANSASDGAVWFPLVGAGVGAVAGTAFWLCHSLGAASQAAAALTTSLALTGALHEDGLADSADALGGGTRPERVFEILKDSRIGTYGAAALVLSLWWRGALLVQLGPEAPAALIVAHSLGRLAPVWLMGTLRYVTPEPVARSRIEGRSPPAVVVAANSVAVAVLVLVRLTTPFGLASLAGAWLATISVTWALGRYFRKRIGGFAGDLLGCAEQVGEVVALVLLTLARAISPF